jgi:DNA-directed RNA polymerase specialized sigma24 family protein
MNLAEAIQSVNMDDVIDRMNAYANGRLKSVGLKNFNGKEPIDFVGELILKIIDEKRDWNKAQCSFEEFLFGCLKSEISNFLDKKKGVYDNDLPELPTTEWTCDIEEKRTQVSELLKQEGATDDEIIIFEYWMDNIFKPAEIAKDLGIEVKEVYNIIKRLERRLPKIQTQATNII